MMSDRRLHGHTPRRLTVLLPVLGLIVFGLPGQAACCSAPPGLGSSRNSSGSAPHCCRSGIVVAAFLWVDRWEPEPAACCGWPSAGVPASRRSPRC